MKNLLFAFAVVAGVFTGVAHADNNCTGATYYDSDTDTCIACPAGYDYNQDAGKDDITDCQIHCEAGTFAPEYTQLEYIESTGTQYINTGISEADIDYIELDFEAQSGGLMFVNGSTQVGMNDGRYGTTILNTKYKIKQELVGNRWYFTNITNGTTFTQPWAAGSGYLYLFALKDGSGVSNYSRAKVYSFSCYSNGTLYCNFIPARRNSDGVLGMYDTVTGIFFTNSGTGTFIAGNDVGAIGDECVNVGAGYWAAASTVNYGSVGTRTACPAGTSTNGADNASECTPCAGATHNNKTAAASCIACPDGYDYNTDAGKTDITQCQIHCDAGTYVSAEYTQLEYIESTGTQYIDTGIVPQNYNYSAEFTMSASGWGKLFFGMSTSMSNTWGGNGYQFGIANGSGNSSWGGASASTVASGLGVSINVFYTYKVTKNGFYVNDVLKSAISSPADFAATGSLYIGRTNNPNAGSYNKGQSKWSMVKIYDDNGVLVFDGIPVRRNSDAVVGMYNMVTGQFFTNSGTGNFIAGPDVGGVIGGECTDVGAGYYAAASTVNFGSVGTRTACPAGLYTVGYGHGADDANDCGRILHIGNNVIYTRRNKETTPSVNIKMDNGDMFYISLSPTDHTVSRLHFQYNGNEYTAYDDGLYYGERNFDTGEQIAQ